MNKVILMGRITRDPETRYTQTKNTLVSTFTLAVNKRGTKDADFFNIVAWSKLGEFVSKYFKKGMQMVLSGRLSTREYEDNNGNKRHITEVIAEEIYFTDKREKSSNK